MIHFRTFGLDDYEQIPLDRVGDDMNKKGVLYTMLKRWFLWLLAFLHLSIGVTSLVFYYTRSPTDRLNLPVTRTQLFSISVPPNDPIPYTNPLILNTGLTTQTFFEARTAVLYNIDVVVYIALFSFITFLEHTIQASAHQWFLNQVEKRHSTLTWLCYAVSAPMISTAMQHMTGVTELLSLVGVFLSTSATMITGLAIDVSLESRPKSTYGSWKEWLFFALGTAFMVPTWTLILYSTFLVEGLPVLVHAAVITQTLWFASFGINMFLFLAGVYEPKTDQAMPAYTKLVCVNLMLSLAAKLNLPVFILFGAMRSVGTPFFFPLPI